MIFGATSLAYGIVKLFIAVVVVLKSASLELLVPQRRAAESFAESAQDGSLAVQVGVRLIPRSRRSHTQLKGEVSDKFLERASPLLVRRDSTAEAAFSPVSYTHLTLPTSDLV